MAYYATIAERQPMLCRDGCVYSCRRHTPQPKSGLTLYDSTHKVEQPTHNTRKCVLDFAAGCASYANPIGVRVSARALHRHRCLYSSVTLVDAIDTPTPYTHDSPQSQPPTGNCADLEVSEIFVIFM